jgi:hypothetical protein
VRGTSENFVRIGHSIMALFLAFAGGCLSRLLHDRSNARTQARAESPSDRPVSVGEEGDRDDD